MDMNRELDGLIERMVTEYVARNRAAKILRGLLDDAGVGFFPVVDHLTLRTLDIDRRAEQFVALGYAFDETLQYDDWYAKVYRKVGYPALFVDQAYGGSYVYSPEEFTTGNEFRMQIIDARDPKSIHKEMVFTPDSKLIQQLRADFSVAPGVLITQTP